MSTAPTPSRPPRVVIVAGPNGAGKTTTARRLLQGAMAVHEFVNADVIAQGLSAFRPEAAAMQAGRVMLGRLKALAGSKADFAFETTLASRHFAPWVADLIRNGYEFYLVFLWLPSPALAVRRVASRVRAGGHHVPAEVVRRRYDSGLRNFFEQYQPLAKRWRVYDNSGPEPRAIAAGSRSRVTGVSDPEVWRGLQREYGRGTEQ